MTTNVNITVRGSHNVRVSLLDRQEGQSGAEKWKAGSDSFDLKPGEHREVVIHGTRRLQVEETSEAGSNQLETGHQSGRVG